jgi:hypothetical protein
MGSVKEWPTLIHDGCALLCRKRLENSLVPQLLTLTQYFINSRLSFRDCLESLNSPVNGGHSAIAFICSSDKATIVPPNE